MAAAQLLESGRGTDGGDEGEGGAPGRATGQDANVALQTAWPGCPEGSGPAQ